MPPQEKPPEDPSAPSPVPGASATGESGPKAPGPEPGGAAPQGHTVRTPAFPANAHRLLPRATPLGGGVGMGLGSRQACLGGRQRSRAPATLRPCRGTQAPFPPAPNVAARRSGPQRRPGCPPALPERSVHSTFPSLEPVTCVLSALVPHSAQRPCLPPPPAASLVPPVSLFPSSTSAASPALLPSIPPQLPTSQNFLI